MILVLIWGKFVSVLERPSSQMSYFDQFIKESSTRHGGSVESEEGDIEDNRAPSLTSSKSNLSELSIVSFQKKNCSLKLNRNKNFFNFFLGSQFTHRSA